MDVEFNAQFRADRDAFVTSVSDTAFNISLKAIKTATARRRFSHTKLNVTTFPQIDLQMKKKSEQCPTVLRITPQSKSVNMFNYGAFCVLYLRLQTKMWGHWVRGNLYNRVMARESNSHSLTTLQLQIKLALAFPIPTLLRSKTCFGFSGTSQNQLKRSTQHCFLFKFRTFVFFLLSYIWLIYLSLRTSKLSPASELWEFQGSPEP